jgi:hypothetical protein
MAAAAAACLSSSGCEPPVIHTKQRVLLLQQLLPLCITDLCIWVWLWGSESCASPILWLLPVLALCISLLRAVLRAAYRVPLLLLLLSLHHVLLLVVLHVAFCSAAR